MKGKVDKKKKNIDPIFLGVLISVVLSLIGAVCVYFLISNKFENYDFGMTNKLATSIIVFAGCIVYNIHFCFGKPSDDYSIARSGNKGVEGAKKRLSECFKQSYNWFWLFITFIVELGLAVLIPFIFDRNNNFLAILDPSRALTIFLPIVIIVHLLGWGIERAMLFKYVI